MAIISNSNAWIVHDDVPAGYEQTAQDAVKAVGQVFDIVSKCIDITTLESVTVAFDYKSTLLAVDRGVASQTPLVPSDGAVQGIAMTPRVLRGGNVKSQIILDANLVCSMLSTEQVEDQLQFVNIIAHECAHVELDAAFDRCFPGVLLQEKYTSDYDKVRRSISEACWDEYGATRRSALLGGNPADELEAIFINCLDDAGAMCNQFIQDYHSNGKIDDLFWKSTGALGNLMKFAAYLMGNNDGREMKLSEAHPIVVDKLSDHWFEPFFMQLHCELDRLYGSLGVWRNKSEFDVIGDIAIDLLRDRGLCLRLEDDGRTRLDVIQSPAISALRALFGR